MITKSDILDFLKRHNKKLQNDFGVTKIGLFGSYVRGEETENSDIDILVELNSKNKYRSFFQLKYFLEENFKKNVDLGTKKSLKPLLKKNIEKEIVYV